MVHDIHFFQCRTQQCVVDVAKARISLVIERAIGQLIKTQEVLYVTISPFEYGFDSHKGWRRGAGRLGHVEGGKEGIGVKVIQSAIQWQLVEGVGTRYLVERPVGNQPQI